MSIELYFLINLLADFSLLFAAARGLGCLRIRRVGLAAALSAGYGTLAECLPGAAAPPLQLILLIPLSMLVTHSASPRRIADLGIALAVTALVTGTCAAYSRHPPLAVAVVPSLYALATRMRRRSLAEPRARVEVVHRGRTSVLDACIDTGNRLTEPLSGQPVLIANARLLRGVLPDTGFREVPYGSVGGAGTLRCFRPDRVYIDCAGRRTRAPDSWIAVYPERLPGPYQALAPAEYVLQ